MPSPQQQILRTGAEGPGAATEALIGALVSGKGGGVVGNLISNAIGGKGGASAAGTALNAAIRSGVGGIGKWFRENLGETPSIAPDLTFPEEYGDPDMGAEASTTSPDAIRQMLAEVGGLESVAGHVTDFGGGESKDIFTPTTELDWARWDQEEQDIGGIAGGYANL
tara:strand:- start:232 stop:732 length:501 start_codon:yes stop_codon:yes gene_type:complete